MCHPPVCEYDWSQCQYWSSWIDLKLEGGLGAIFAAVGYCWALLSLLLSMVLALVQSIRLCTVLVRPYGWVDVDAGTVPWQCPKQHYISLYAQSNIPTTLVVGYR